MTHQRLFQVNQVATLVELLEIWLCIDSTTEHFLIVIDRYHFLIVRNMNVSRVTASNSDSKQRNVKSVSNSSTLYHIASVVPKEDTQINE